MYAWMCAPRCARMCAYVRVRTKIDPKPSQADGLPPSLLRISHSYTPRKKRVSVYLSAFECILMYLSTYYYYFRHSLQKRLAFDLQSLRSYIL